MTNEKENTPVGGIAKVVAPLLIFGALGGIAMTLFNNPPERASRDRQPPRLVIEATELTPQQYTVQLQSYGTVQPRVQSMLVSQIAGQIVAMNPAFREGGFFERGETLIRIDDREYIDDVRIAEASLLEARQVLAEAEARSEQALRDWERLGNEGEPPPLVVREPQLLSARARLASAEAAVDKARLNVQRTRIDAPFAGRVLRQSVDLGQVVTANTTLGEVYSTDVVEVRLPLRNSDLSFINLPEEFRFDEGSAGDGATVRFVSDLGLGGSWNGRLVRTEGAIDPTARQLFVVAQIDKPFEQSADARTPLKIGQYLTAEISGNTLDGVLVVPNEVIYQGSYVYVVADGILDRRQIEISWQNDVESIIAGGVEAGDQLVTTPLGQVASGTRVSIAGQADRDRKPSSGGGIANGAAAE
ncbi:MAG: efflux RND transporter periplasmic adaptor subunit [Pseudomonadota bacterium]